MNLFVVFDAMKLLLEENIFNQKANQLKIRKLNNRG